MRAVRNTSVCLVGAVCAAALLVGPSLSAGDILLEDNNAKLRIDPNSDAGMYDWVVDGTDHLVRQWFWYRIGPTGGESPLNALSAPCILVDGDHASISYCGPQGLQVDLALDLYGGSPGSRTSAIWEDIVISNLTGDDMEVHFFEYCDLDVGGDPNDDVAFIMDPNVAIQIDDAALAGQMFFAGLPTTPPTACEVALNPNLYASLTDTGPTTLSNFAGPIGPDNVEWAFQWDLELAAHSSAYIAMDKLVIPEPATLALLSLGLALLPRRRRKR